MCVIRNYRIVLFSIGAFFLLGLGWGIWSNKWISSDSDPELIVLCPKSWIPSSLLEEISRKLKTRAVQLDFDSWSEFVRLAANTQGKADVICFHSFLAKDLIQSKFLDRSQLKSIPEFNNVSADFYSLPFDPNFDYTAPIFWGINGFAIHDVTPDAWSKVWPKQGEKMSLLFPDLELLWRMHQSGLDLNAEETDDGDKKLSSFVQTFLKSLSDVSSNRSDLSDEDLKKFQYIQLSSGPAGVFLQKHPDWKYWLPQDGVSLWMAMVGIGSQSRLKSQARAFIGELLTPEHALALHDILHHGVVQAALNSDDRVLPMQKASYLRQVPLDRVRFPDLSMEILPQWERVVSETRRL